MFLFGCLVGAAVVLFVGVCYGLVQVWGQS